MNCKPHELAIIVNSGSRSSGLAREVARQAIGKIVRVVKLRPPHHPDACYEALVWEIEEPFKIECEGRVFTIGGVGDECLRPIRDPGDDADDEMVQLLGKPSEVSA